MLVISSSTMATAHHRNAQVHPVQALCQGRRALLLPL
jgi:hypothetical protein